MKLNDKDWQKEETDRETEKQTKTERQKLI